MIGSALLALGLVLTATSQLRLSGYPLGGGEFCLALWLGYASLRVLTNGRVCNARALLGLGTFWFCFAFTLSLGTCLALLRQELEPETMLHDTFAYLLAAALSCFVVATMKADGTLNQSLWFLIALWNIALVVQLAMGWAFISLPSVNPWYWDRFRGWSENPNQVALYCAILTALSLHLALSATGLGRLIALSSCLLSLVVGRLTKSDTFLGAMVLSTAVFLVLRLRGWLISWKHRSLRYALTAIVVIGIVPLTISLTPFALAIANDVESLAASMTKDHGGEATRSTASLRLQLWEDAVYRGVEAGSLGLGPGPHLDRPNTALLQAIPIPFEAHSTPLDVFTQAGLLGLLTVCGLFAGTFLLVLRTKHDALAMLIVALALFSINHFIFRHPIVWFALAVSLILSTERAPSHARTGT
jgi:hypothetical protein